MDAIFNSEKQQDPIALLAKKIFAIPYLYPIQRYTIANVLDGINQIVILPTGSGKSLCFQLPALIMPGITFIIVPLLSLMTDQIRRFEEKGIKCDCIKGEQTEEERTEILINIKAKKTKIVFITPESLSSKKSDNFFDQIEIEHLVIDEAHCVTEWGNTFRPAYLQIGEFIKNKHIGRVTAFTATASETVLESIKRSLFDDLPVVVLIENPDRTNIIYKVIPVISKSRAITNLVATQASPLLIFTRSRIRAEFYARLLKMRFPAKEIYFYHAGLSKEERQNVEKWFMQTDKGILSTTSAFGLGIDKFNVRTVIHAEIPYSIEAYLQESGRAGRDKKESDAILLYTHEDRQFSNKLTDKIQKTRYNNLLRYVGITDSCRRATLLSLMDYALETECSGCDVCNGNAVKAAEGKKVLHDFFKRHRRRFTLRETIQVLQGRQTLDAVQKKLDQYHGWAGLHSWEYEDIAEGIDSLINEGLLKVPAKGFWKYHITPGSK